MSLGLTFFFSVIVSMCGAHFRHQMMRRSGALVAFVCLLLQAWLTELASVYQQILFVGLILSLSGNTLLMWFDRKLKPTIILFGIAYLCFSFAFWHQVEGELVWWLPTTLLSAGIIYFLVLLPELGRFTLPVLLYMLLMVQLCWAAGEFWRTTGSMAGLFAFCGTLALVVVDTSVGLHRFRGPLRFGRVVTVGSLYLALSLFVASLCA